MKQDMQAKKLRSAIQMSMIVSDFVCLEDCYCVTDLSTFFDL